MNPETKFTTHYLAYLEFNNWNQMWFIMVCALIDNEYASSTWWKCCGITRPQQNLTSNLDQIREQNTINHISICLLPQYQRQRKLFFRVQAKTGITYTPHIDASSVVWTLIDNHEQISQSDCETIVIKYYINNHDNTFNQCRFPGSYIPWKRTMFNTQVLVNLHHLPVRHQKFNVWCSVYTLCKNSF